MSDQDEIQEVVVKDEERGKTFKLDKHSTLQELWAVGPDGHFRHKLSKKDKAAVIGWIEKHEREHITIVLRATENEKISQKIKETEPIESLYDIREHAARFKLSKSDLDKVNDWITKKEKQEEKTAQLHADRTNRFSTLEEIDERSEKYWQRVDEKAANLKRLAYGKNKHLTPDSSVEDLVTFRANLMKNGAEHWQDAQDEYDVLWQATTMWIQDAKEKTGPVRVASSKDNSVLLSKMRDRKAKKPDKEFLKED